MLRLFVRKRWFLKKYNQTFQKDFVHNLPTYHIKETGKMNHLPLNLTMNSISRNMQENVYILLVRLSLMRKILTECLDITGNSKILNF